MVQGSRLKHTLHTCCGRSLDPNTPRNQEAATACTGLSYRTPFGKPRSRQVLPDTPCPLERFAVGELARSQLGNNGRFGGGAWGAGTTLWGGGVQCYKAGPSKHPFSSRGTDLRSMELSSRIMESKSGEGPPRSSSPCITWEIHRLVFTQL